MKKSILFFTLLTISLYSSASLKSFSPMEKVKASDMNHNFNTISNILTEKNKPIFFNNFQSNQTILVENFESEFNKLRNIGATIPFLSPKQIKSSEINAAFSAIESFYNNIFFNELINSSTGEFFSLRMSENLVNDFSHSTFINSSPEQKNTIYSDVLPVNNKWYSEFQVKSNMSDVLFGLYTGNQSPNIFEYSNGNNNFFNGSGKSSSYWLATHPYRIYKDGSLIFTETNIDSLDLDIVGIAVDLIENKLSFYINGSLIHQDISISPAFFSEARLGFLSSTALEVSHLQHPVFLPIGYTYFKESTYGIKEVLYSAKDSVAPIGSGPGMRVGASNLIPTTDFSFNKFTVKIGSSSHLSGVLLKLLISEVVVDENGSRLEDIASKEILVNDINPFNIDWFKNYAYKDVVFSFDSEVLLKSGKTYIYRISHNQPNSWVVLAGRTNDVPIGTIVYYDDSSETLSYVPYFKIE